MSGYFNTTLTGLCYLNNIREVAPKKGPRYFVVRVKLLQGPREGATGQSIHLRMNANVFSDALKGILKPYVGSKDQIRGVVSISDLSLSTYQDKQSQTLPCLYGRLFSLRKLWVGETLVHSHDPAAIDAPAAQPVAA